MPHHLPYHLRGQRQPAGPGARLAAGQHAQLAAQRVQLAGEPVDLAQPGFHERKEYVITVDSRPPREQVQQAIRDRLGLPPSRLAAAGSQAGAR